MTDIMTPEQRRFCMSQIKGKNTKPEIVVRKWLWRNGYRYRINDKRFPGKPDIVISRLKTVIFINGCFWHGHTSCNKFKLPKTNTQFWSTKITRNQERDAANHTQLKLMGWTVLIVWECQLKRQNLINTLQALTVRLSQIYLSQFKPKPTTYAIDSDASFAAENNTDYGGK
jgi:DNA mismatch endonuclease (patch repair protein)